MTTQRDFSNLSDWVIRLDEKPAPVHDYDNTDIPTDEVHSDLFPYLPQKESNSPIGYFNAKVLSTDEHGVKTIKQQGKGEWQPQMLKVMDSLRLKIRNDGVEPFLEDTNVSYDFAANQMGDPPFWKVTQWKVEVIDNKQSFRDTVTWEKQGFPAVKSVHDWKIYPKEAPLDL